MAAYGGLGFCGRRRPCCRSCLPLVGLIVLLGVVFACVHHADVIAHRTGEPYGTLVLTIAVTVIEVALILSIMLAGDGQPTLARETVFSVIMIVCNGVVGLCIILGGLRYGEQGFQVPGINAYLVVLIPLATLVLILPTYTTSVPGPSTRRASWRSSRWRPCCSMACSSTSRQCATGLLPVGSRERPRRRDAARVAAALGERVLLLVGLVAVVLLAKSVAGSIETVVDGDRRADRGRRASGRVAGAAARDRGGAGRGAAQRAAEEPQPRAWLLARHHRPHHSGGQHPRPDPEGSRWSSASTCTIPSCWC